MTPVPYSRLEARMVARLASAGTSRCSEYCTSRDSNGTEPTTCVAMRRRRRSLASSPCTFVVTAPSAESALPPPLNSRRKSSSTGTSLAASRRRRLVTADLSANAQEAIPLTNPSAPRTATLPPGITEVETAPRTAVQPERASANAVKRSGLSFQPARPIRPASQFRAPTAANAFGPGLASPVAGFGCAWRRRANHAAALMRSGRPAIAITATVHDAPATRAPIVAIGSGIIEPHTFESRQLQQTSHPDVAAAHDRQHREQERLPRWIVKRRQVRRMQRGGHDQECDGE